MTTVGAEKPITEKASPARHKSEGGVHDDGLSAFAEVRPRLFGIAYRVLGSAAEAEDIVQDVWLRWQATDRSVVQNPPAFLATTTTRMCINFAYSIFTSGAYRATASNAAFPQEKPHFAAL